MKSSVLLTTTEQWFAVARLAMALDGAGFVVNVLCPAANPLEKVRVVQKTYLYRTWSPRRSLRAAILKARPNLVIPCDDVAMLHLHLLHRSEHSRGPIASLIEYSLGDPASFAALESRNDLMAVADQEGISIPAAAEVRDLPHLMKWLNEQGYPAVLKADGTSGGEGVRVVESVVDAERAFSSLREPPLLAKAAKRLLVNRDGRLLRSCVLRKKATVSVQSFVHGREASSAVACWKGEVLAAIHFEVLRTSKPKGPASVLRVVENVEMASTVSALVHRLQLSGLCGFDFMIDKQSGKAMLIEMNARSTQTCHFALGSGRDLAATLWSAVSGQPQPIRKTEVTSDVIALFPQEWKAHPDSAFLQTAHHDVPWSEPDLMSACVASYTPQEKWYASETFTALCARLPWYRA